MTTETIITALRAAREIVHTERTHLADAHMSPVTNQLDADGEAGVAEYDVVLRQIDAAVAAATAGEQESSRRVTVDAGALVMVRNALRRDADEGKQARGEMLEALDSTTLPAPPQPAAPQQFDDWWEREGQFHRAGGGQYEKTFAWHAWRAALAAPQPVAVPQAGDLYRGKCHDGARCLHGCHTNEPCHSAPQVPQPVAVPQGYAVVPVEPTPEMLEAARDVKRQRLLRAASELKRGSRPDTIGMALAVNEEWGAMLAAAPQAPSRDWFSVTEIAEAAQHAEVSDGQFTAMLIALNDAFKARAHGITKEGAAK